MTTPCARPSRATECIDDSDTDSSSPPSGTTDGRRLACALLHRPAPISFGVLAAPITAGGAHIDYTLGDVQCTPPRLAISFFERLVLLPSGAYPFAHATWAAHSADEAMRTPRRSDEVLPSSSLVLASFVQRWKLNPITWSAWTNVLRRTPHSVLWLLQHPLDGARQRLSRMLSEEMHDLRHARLVVMRRQPLTQHLRRTGLADLVLDTWPYTAHTTAADALWKGGVPWLALSASDDRMDSLLSRAVLAHAGGLPLVTTSLRAFEDTAMALMRHR
jgi:predicted O-linked N-acetylglucosamine transferase (SPINDLY family)